MKIQYEIELDDIIAKGHSFLGDFTGQIKIDGIEVEEYNWFTYKQAKKYLAINPKLL